jgi:hypothetical protein
MALTKRLFFFTTSLATLIWLASLARGSVFPLLAKDLDDETWQQYYRAITTTINVVIAATLVASNMRAKTAGELYAHEAGVIILLAVDWPSYLQNVWQLASLPVRTLTDILIFSGILIAGASYMMRRKVRVPDGAGRSRIL